MSRIKLVESYCYLHLGAILSERALLDLQDYSSYVVIRLLSAVRIFGDRKLVKGSKKQSDLSVLCDFNPPNSA